MITPITCSKCGATISGTSCTHCDHKVDLGDYGFSFSKTSAGWIMRTPRGTSEILTSLGDRRAQTISKDYGIDLSIVKTGLSQAASISVEKAQVDEDEDGPVIRFQPMVKGPDFLAEMIWDGKTGPRYVVKNFNREEFDYSIELSLGEVDNQGREIIYRPPYNDHLTKGLVLTPQSPEPSTFQEVVSDAFKFVLDPQNFDPCGNVDLLKLISLITMGSWFLDRMIPQTSIPIAGVGRFAPIIPIRGPSGSGKNRLANLLRFLSYRPYFDLSKTQVPSLFRPLDIWRGTLIMDEGDFFHTGTTSELIHFLNSRATGTPISRQNPEDAKQGQAFESFGITIVTQRQQFDDNATEDRSVSYYTQKSMTRLPTLELDELVEQGLEIQNKLLYLRLTKWPLLNIDKRYWHPMITDARLNASLLPTIALAAFEPEIMKTVDASVNIIEETKLRLKANSLDGQIINYLWEKLEDELIERHNEFIYILDEKTVEKENGDLIVNALTPAKISDKLKIKSKTIRKIINSLGLTPKDAPDRINVGKTFRPFFIDPLRMEKSLREFVVDYQYWQLYSILGIKAPNDVTLVTNVTDAMRQGVSGKNNITLDSFSENTPDTQEASQPSQPSQIKEGDKP